MNKLKCTLRICILLEISLLFCCLAVGKEKEGKELKIETKVLCLAEPGDIESFNWSPNGQFISYIVDYWKTNIVWSENDCEENISLVDIRKNIEEGNKSRLTKDSSLLCVNTSIAWSSDSKKVIFGDGIGVRGASYVLDLQSGKKEMIPKPENWAIIFEQFSPISDMIICEAVYADTAIWTNIEPKNRIVNLEAFGPSRVALIDLDKKKFKLLTDGKESEYGEFGPGWFPDGKNVLYFTLDWGPEGGLWSYYKIDLQTGIKRKIYEEREGYRFLGFSQDGKEIVIDKFEQKGSCYYGSWVLKTDGSGELRRLTDSLETEAPTTYYRQVLSSDLRYVADLFVENGKTYLRIRELRTGKQKLLDAYLQLPSQEFPIAWSPDGKSVCYLAKPADSSHPVIMLATIEE